MGPILPVYREASGLRLENNAHSFEVHFPDPEISLLTGGPLGGEYKVSTKFAQSECKTNTKFCTVVN